MGVPGCSPSVLPGRAKPELPNCATAAVPDSAKGGLPEVDRQPERHHIPDPRHPPSTDRCRCISSSEQPEQPPGDSSEFKQGCSDPPAAASGRQEGAGEEETGIAPAATAAISQPVSRPVQRLKPCFNLWHWALSHSLGGWPAEGAVQPWRRFLIHSKLTKIHGSIQQYESICS